MGATEDYNAMMAAASSGNNTPTPSYYSPAPTYAPPIPAATNNQTVAQMVNNAYNTVLGRNAEADGSKYWQDRITSGSLSPSDLNNEIAKIGASFNPSTYSGTVSPNVLQNSIYNAQNYLSSQDANSKAQAEAFAKAQAEALAYGIKPPTPPSNVNGNSNAGQVGLSSAMQSEADKKLADQKFKDDRVQNMQTLMPQYQGIFNPAPSSSAKGSGTKGAAQAAAPVRNSSSMKGA